MHDTLLRFHDCALVAYAIYVSMICYRSWRSSISLRC